MAQAVSTLLSRRTQVVDVMPKIEEGGRSYEFRVLARSIWLHKLRLLSPLILECKA